MASALDRYELSANDDGTYTIGFAGSDGISGVSDPQATFSRAKQIVAELKGTDSDLYTAFNEEDLELTVTRDQLREITKAMKHYEENIAGIGEDKMVYESRTILNNLHGRLKRKFND